MSTNNKHVFGIGKGKWRMLERGRIFQVWIKNQLIYNPTNVALPVNLQTPQAYTFQSFKPRKHTPLTLKLIPLTLKTNVKPYSCHICNK
jgi:hypothetical protein